ncbi:MAG: 1-acyl-sn-glycerol-3-phosphate acyltransferase [Myxococcota bacterium]
MLRLIGLVNLFVFGCFTLITLLLAVPLQLLALPFDPDRHVAANLARAVWGIGLIRGQPFWRLTITGVERLGRGPWILVANHQSMLDIPLLMNLPVPIRVVARPGVFRMPVFGQMARFGRHVRIDPDRAEEGLAACRAWLGKGVTVAMFPEGSRGDGEALQPFNRGAFELAIRAGADVVPVAISGTADALPKGSPFARVPIARFHLQVLEPLRSEGQTRRRLAAEAFRRIDEATRGPRPWEVSAKAAAMYAGRARRGWAKGKSSIDPVFWALWERLPRSGVLVDVGAGEGLLGAYLRAAGSEVDYRGYDVDVARAAASPVPVAHGDVRTVDLPRADAVTCVDVLHYLGDVDAIVGRLCDALAPGGVLFVRDPEAGRGFASAWTAGAEKALVAAGRHAGEGVQVHGGAVLARAMASRLVDVRVEDCSRWPFANVLVSGRKPE